MRKFWLQNSAGQRFPLNGEQGVYSSNWSGLGFARDVNTVNISNGFFLSTRADDSQAAPACTLTFAGSDPYTQYRDFVSWYIAGSPIQLVYQPTPDSEYLRDFVIKSLAKSEINAVGWLECPVNAITLSPWYQVQDVPGTDVTSFTASALGQLPTAFEIHLTGVTGTQVTVSLGTSAAIYLTSDVYDFQDADKFVISSRRNAIRVLCNGEDFISRLNLDRNPFYNIPPGQTVTVSTDHGILDGSKIYHYWRAV